MARFTDRRTGASVLVDDADVPSGSTAEQVAIGAIAAGKGLPSSPDPVALDGDSRMLHPYIAAYRSSRAAELSVLCELAKAHPPIPGVVEARNRLAAELLADLAPKG